MAHTIEIIKKYMQLIEENIQDPNPERVQSAKKWVYDDIPQANLSAQNYPRISVIEISNTAQPHLLGSTARRYTLTLAIQIRLLKGQKFLIKSKELRDYEVIDHIMGKIDRLFMDYDILAELRKLGVCYLFPDTINSFSPDRIIAKEMLIRNIVVIKNGK